MCSDCPTHLGEAEEDFEEDGLYEPDEEE